MRKQDINGSWHSGIPSWAELKKMAQAGTISQVLSEGDLIPIRLASGEENAIRVTHDQADNMFFVFESCLDKPFSMNRSATNVGGWAKSEMRAYHLNREIAKQLPDDLLESIETISIEQEMPDKRPRVWSRDKLFLLSEEQVFGKSRYSKSEKGVSQLKIFEGSMERRVKNWGGKPLWWWLRSPRESNTSYFVDVSSDGSVYYNDAYATGGVAPGFCLIEPKKI